MAVWANWKFYVDWNNDGDFSDPAEDVSSYFLGAEWDWGRSSGSELVARGAAATCTLRLDNKDGTFSDSNVASPIFGLAIPGRLVKITMQIGAGPVKTKFQGKLSTLVAKPTELPQFAEAVLVATGVLEWLQRRKKVRISLQENKTAHQLLDAIADAAAWPAGERDFDTGQTKFQKFWTDEITALEAMRLVEDTEGGFLREAQDGKVRYEARNYRFTGARLTPQAIYANDMYYAGSPAYLRYTVIEPEGIAVQNVFNKVEAQARTFDETEDKLLVSLANIYAENGIIGQPIYVAKGATKIVDMQYPNPDSPNGEIGVKDWTLTVYNANTAPDGSGTDLTTEFTATQVKTSNKLSVTFTNTSGSNGYLTVCQAWGKAIIEGPPITKEQHDDTSILDFGECVYPFPGKFLTDETEAQGSCNWIVSRYKRPNRAVTMQLEGNRDDASLLEVYTRDVSDRITIMGDSKTSLYINTDFFVEHIRLVLSNNGIVNMYLTCHVVAGIEWGAVDIPYTAKIKKTVPDPVTEIYLSESIIQSDVSPDTFVRKLLVRWTPPNDLLYDHAIIKYVFESTDQEMRYAGATALTTYPGGGYPGAGAEFLMTPEVPNTIDTTITVYVFSANIDESGVTALDDCPTKSLVLARDIGNPSGASGLQVLGHDDDADIPAGQFVFQFNRETVNYATIYAVGAWASDALPGQGPYAAERALYPGATLESGTCTIVQGATGVTVTRAADAGVIGKVILTYTNDVNPDSDLEGNIIETQGANALSVYGSNPFHKTGTYNYDIVQPWWDATVSINRAYFDFRIPDDLEGGAAAFEAAVWRLKPKVLPAGMIFVTLANRNQYGVGTRLTYPAGTGIPVGVPVITPVPGSSGAVVTVAEDPTIIIDCSLGDYFVITLTANRILGNPINAYYGQEITVVVVQGGSGGYIFSSYGDKWDFGDADDQYVNKHASPDFRSIVMQNYAGSVKKRVMLNDTGDGFVFGTYP